MIFYEDFGISPVHTAKRLIIDRLSSVLSFVMLHIPVCITLVLFFWIWRNISKPKKFYYFCLNLITIVCKTIPLINSD